MLAVVEVILGVNQALEVVVLAVVVALALIQVLEVVMLVGLTVVLDIVVLVSLARVGWTM